MSQSLRWWLVREWVTDADADVGRPTHLTVDWVHNVEINQVKNDCDKGGHARE